MKKQIQITVWEKPGEVVSTAHGPIPFRLWCELERWRFAQAGREARIVTGPDKRIALFRDR